MYFFKTTKKIYLRARRVFFLFCKIECLHFFPFLNAKQRKLFTLILLHIKPICVGQLHKVLSFWTVSKMVFLPKKNHLFHMFLNETIHYIAL